MIHIDRDRVDVPAPRMTARELLELAGKRRPESFAFYRKIKGSQPERIDLDARIDLSDGDRFITLPLDQTEGLTGVPT